MLKRVVLALSLGSAIVAGPCMAHAKLQSSTPADNAQLASTPKTLTLNFSESAQLAVLKLTINGKDIPVSVDRTAKASQTFTLPLPSLAPGKYTVQWSAVAADDGHVTKGSFAFSVMG